MNTALGRGAYARRHYNVWRNGAPREALKPGKESHVRGRGGGRGEGGWGGWCKWGNATENKPRESKPGQLLRAWTSLPNRGAIFSKPRFYLLEHFSVNREIEEHHLILRRTKLGVGQSRVKSEMHMNLEDLLNVAVNSTFSSLTGQYVPS